MEQTSPAPHRPKPTVARLLELWLFRSRWLMAPFYVGLVLALFGLLYVFCAEVWNEVRHIAQITEPHAVALALSLIDVSLTANLIVIVIFAGYETFVTKMDLSADEERPDWMGSIDYSGMKMKLMASIVAISAVALLRAFMRLAEDQPLPQSQLVWLIAIHLTFVVSALLLAVMDFVVGKTTKH